MVVLVGGAQAVEPDDVSLQSGLLHKTLVASRDRLGHRKLIGTLTNIPAEAGH